MKLFKKCLSYILIGGVMVTALTAPVVTVSAESTDPGLPGALYTVSRASDLPICEKESITVKNLTFNDQGAYDGIVSACVTHGEKLDYATSSSLRTVRVEGQEKFTKITNATSLVVGSDPEVASLRYDENDTPSWSGRYIGITQNFSQALIPQLRVDSAGNTQVVSYTLDTSSFKQIIDSEGSKVQVVGMALSSNGRFVVFADQDYKLSLFDREKNTTKVVAESIRYWKGIYSEPQFGAVSNNGRFVYIGGYERMYDTHDCPEKSIECHYIENVDYKRSGLRMAQAYFDEANEKLLLVSQNDIFSSGYHEINLEGYLKDPNESMGLDYLALGDSYSSGEGDLGQDEDGKPYYIVNGDINCHLSSRSYPFLLRDAWSVDYEKMKSVACSGALVTKDYTMPLADYSGQHGEFTKLSSSTTREDYINITLDNFVPGRIPQIEFVKKYQPKIITLTGGGNDVGFANILTYCAGDVLESFFGYTCEYVKGGKLHDILNDAIDSQYKPTRELIESLKSASPGSKIYYIGYPSFIAGSDTTCAFNNGAVDDYERDMINEAVTRLNGVIKQTTADTGVQYVDIEDALYGGRLCEGSDYMTGIWDVGITNKDERVQSFHPNSLGHKKISEKILKAVSRAGVDYKPTEPKVATIQPGVKTSRARIVKDDTVPEGEMLEIELRPGTSAGSSDIVVPAFSNEVLLGVFKSQPDGSLDVSVYLPKDLTPGHHLILLNLTAPNGEPERLYQFITILATEPQKHGLDEGNNHVENGPNHMKAPVYLAANVANESFYPYSHELPVLGAEESSTKYAISSVIKHEDEETKNTSYIVKIIGILLALGIIGGGALYVKKYKL